ncbi:hypothetical protein LINPERPRIM_LOCUS37950 [Linum perenne]
MHADLYINCDLCYQAFIEEFNYPMPRNCGGGKTGVFVNGRELHEQDLECLSKRGLPTLEHMFYILEIDGRLYDMTLGESFMGLANLLQRVFGPSVGRMPYGTSKFNQRATKTNSCLFQRTVKRRGARARMRKDERKRSEIKISFRHLPYLWVKNNPQSK